MMLYQHVFIYFLVLPTFHFWSAEMKRNKRILYGHEARNRDIDAYQTFRYYVFLARAPPGVLDENPKGINNFWDYLAKLLPGPDKLIHFHNCGGTLLTPNVVQTACHCIAVYHERVQGGNYTYAYPLNVWEDRIYSYVGSNRVSKMYDILLPKHYIIYQSCKAVLHHIQSNLMDYGLIITKDSVDKKAPNAPISYAPAYKARDILEFYYKAITQEFMCLVVGHGSWNVPNVPYPDEFEPFVEDGSSETMLWGWRTTMNYIDCHSASYPIELRKKTSEMYLRFNYTRDASWVCLQAFKDWKRWLYLFGGGDSGGPVACNGIYFAIASMASAWLSMAAPIAHTAFENSAEYRDQFLGWCTKFEGVDKDIPFEHITDKNYIPTPPSIYHSPDIPLSHSFVATIHQPFLLLSAIFMTIG